jgi:hypothetical protein
MSERDEEVGYRNPPRHTRFKKGQSGNSAGRPRKEKTAPDFESQARAALRETVRIREGGKTKKVTTAVAIAKSVVAQASKGKAKPLAAVHRSLAKQEGARRAVRAKAEEAERARCWGRFVTRLRHILDTRMELKIETRRVLRAHGVPDPVIDDVFDLAGVGGPEAEDRRAWTRAAMREFLVPEGLIAAAGGVDDVYDYFYRDRVGWVPEDPERMAMVDAEKAGDVS